MKRKRKNDWFDLEDTQGFFNRNRITIWRWCKKGLPHIRVGNQLFFKRRDLLRWRKLKKKRGEIDDNKKGIVGRERRAEK
jgi:hypothetical protein